MIPTPVGLLLLPIGAVLFLLGSRWLFLAVVVSAQFFYVRAIDASAIGTDISPTELFGGLLIARLAFEVAVTGRLRKFEIPGGRMLLLFLAAITVSIFMPRLLAGHVVVVAGETSYKEYIYAPLRFRIGNLTQLVFPLFQVTLFLAMCMQMRTRESVAQVLRISMICSLLVLGSGLLYQFGFFLGLEGIVDRFFWFFTGEMGIRDLEVQVGRLRRMYSLAGEPGYTGAYFLFVLGFVAVAASMPDANVTGWSRRRLQLMFAAMVVGIVLTGGTTGIVGLMLFGGFLVFMALAPLPGNAGDRAGMRRVARQVLGGLAILVVLVIVLFPLLAQRSFLTWLIQTHLSKLAGAEVGSGDQRLGIIFDAIDIFRRYPILGVGYGSHRVSALLFSLLANTGIVGTVLFLGFNGAMLMAGIRVYLYGRDGRDRAVGLGAGASLVSFLGVALIAKGVVTLLFAYYWLILAILVAVSGFGMSSAPKTALAPVPALPVGGPATSV